MRIHINTHVSAREPADTGDDDDDDEDPPAPPSVPRTDGAITDRHEHVVRQLPCRTTDRPFDDARIDR